MPLLDLTADEARAFLLAMRDGRSPAIAADHRTGFQITFATSDGRPEFKLERPGEEQTTRRFEIDQGIDMQSLVDRLLFGIGP